MSETKRTSYRTLTTELGMSIKTKEDVLSHSFPPAIAAAQTRFAMHVANWDLNVKVIRLAQIFISHSPLSALDRAVVCSRQKAAEMLGVHERTITRYTIELESRGVIDRLPQTFSEDGKPGCMRFRWTEAGKTLFVPPMRELNTQPFPSNPQVLSPTVMLELLTPQILDELPSLAANELGTDRTKVESRDSAEHMSHGTAQLLCETNLSHITTTSCKQEVSIENKHSHSMKIAKAPRLPEDIIGPAASLQLKRQQICHLFTRCRAIGQRLQDVFSVSLDTMISKKLTGNAAMAWIISLLQSGRDFSYAVRQQQIQLLKAEEDTRKQQDVRAAATFLSCNPVLLPNGRWLKEVKYDIAFFTDAQSDDSIGSQPIRELAKCLVEHHSAWLDSYMRGEKSFNVKRSSMQADLIPKSSAIQRSIGRAAIRDIRQVIGHKLKKVLI
jgi:hypothetical protein